MYKCTCTSFESATSAILDPQLIKNHKFITSYISGHLTKIKLK